MPEKIKLGISACLLGHDVRYSGGHARDLFVIETFAPYVEFVPVCPEVESGMPVPREAIHLVGAGEEPRLLGVESKLDFTRSLQEWAAKRLEKLESENLCGFIFKKNSPSCGLRRLSVSREDQGPPQKNGVGIFARAFGERFPLIPAEEDGHLHDASSREHFIERIFIMQRWRQLLREPLSRGRLIDFHTRHKLIFLAHSPKGYRSLGKLVAGLDRSELDTAGRKYHEEMCATLQRKTSPSKHVNVMQHMLGYFKRQLTRDEKQEMLDLIENFRAGRLPLIAPMTMFQHYTRKYNYTYLAGQHYVEPHPLELKLRYHC
ncbi:MAG TPA: DUF1722 domain-containing protein [Proteobacteria bacterium]|nr:DUF1722 domain-containing protein [Pseudomonadota bacterium]